MLEILQINVRIEMTLQTMDKTVNFSCTVQFFVLGHVTVGVSQWRHQLARTHILKLLSKSKVMSSYSQLNFP